MRAAATQLDVSSEHMDVYWLILVDSDDEILERYKQYRERAGGTTQISGVREEGVDMSPVDLVRNFVHEHFDGEVAQRGVYERLWLPIERTCSEAAASAGLQIYTWEACERVFALALAHLVQSGGTCAGVSAVEGSKIYGTFIEWWEDPSHSQGSVPAVRTTSNCGVDAEMLMARFGEAISAVADTAFS